MRCRASSYGVLIFIVILSPLSSKHADIIYHEIALAIIPNSLDKYTSLYMAFYNFYGMLRLITVAKISGWADEVQVKTQPQR